MQAAIPLMIAGQLVQGVAGYQAGRATGRAMDVNAANAINDGEAEAAHIRDVSRVAMGEQIGSLAGNGFELGGSATTRLAESALEAELEIADRRRTARSKAQAYRSQGAEARAEGRSRLLGGLFGAASAVTKINDFAQLGARYGYGGRSGGGGSGGSTPTWGQPGHEDVDPYGRPRRSGG